MIKPLTYHKPSGEWGIEGVDLSTLPPQVYGALAKLMRLEHPLCGTRAEMLRLASEEEMAAILSSDFFCLQDCGGFDSCKKCWMDWLLGPSKGVGYENGEQHFADSGSGDRSKPHEGAEGLHSAISG